MDKNLFIKNRNKILNQMVDNSIFVIFSRRLIDDDIAKQTYNVNRNYFYVSGVLEFDNIVILKHMNGKKESIIYINPYDELEAKWVGAPKSIDEIKELSGIEDVRYLDIFNEELEAFLSMTNNIYLDIDSDSSKDPLNQEILFAKKLKISNENLKFLNGKKLFAHSRTVKEPEEIAEIEKAIEITNKGIENILKNIGPMYEYQLESYFDQAIKYNGATGYAFPTIAASGKNATCLHYQDNNQMANDGDLILFDLGCSLNMYCSDISRTYPINGKFSKRQKQIYNIVLNGQQKVFEAAKPGVTTKYLNGVLVDYFFEELKKIGLVNEKEDVKKYYYHAVSHHIGLDCHDLCEYTGLKPGCIISNEPGLYIEEEGIGIRIEDDILITENGAKWLSPQILKTVEDIENFIEGSKK